MSMKDDELLGFYDFLEAREREIQSELVPYFEEFNRREENHMNSYGHIKPKYKVFLNEQTIIHRLKNDVKESESLDNLEDKIKLIDETYQNNFLNYIRDYKSSIANNKEDKRNFL